MVSVAAAAPLSCRVEFLPICSAPLPETAPFCVRVAPAVTLTVPLSIRTPVKLAVVPTAMLLPTSTVMDPAAVPPVVPTSIVDRVSTERFGWLKPYLPLALSTMPPTWAEPPDTAESAPAEEENAA